jgi:DNA-binding transcriptional MocR family regulator
MVSPYYLDNNPRPGLLLGFAAFDERQIDAAMQRLAPIVARAAG